MVFCFNWNWWIVTTPHQSSLRQSVILAPYQSSLRPNPNPVGHPCAITLTPIGHPCAVSSLRRWGATRTAPARRCRPLSAMWPPTCAWSARASSSRAWWRKTGDWLTVCRVCALVFVGLAGALVVVGLAVVHTSSANHMAATLSISLLPTTTTTSVHQHDCYADSQLSTINICCCCCVPLTIIVC